MCLSEEECICVYIFVYVGDVIVFYATDRVRVFLYNHCFNIFYLRTMFDKNNIGASESRTLCASIYLKNDIALINNNKIIPSSSVYFCIGIQFRIISLCIY